MQAAKRRTLIRDVRHLLLGVISGSPPIGCPPRLEVRAPVFGGDKRPAGVELEGEVAAVCMSGQRVRTSQD